MSFAPEHTTYLEPFIGGGAVLLRKNPYGVSEIICDAYGDLTNFWQVLKSPAMFPLFERTAQATPFSEVEWELAREELNVPMDWRADPKLLVRRALAFFVCCRQSMSGRMDNFAPVTTGRLRREMNEQASAWMSAVDGLPTVHSRMMRVLILKPQPAQKLLPRYDKPGVWAYLDPPYPEDARVSPTVYQYEMTPEQHEELLKVLLSIKHMAVAISSYPNEMYDRLLKRWRKADKTIDNKSSKKKVKDAKIERLYMNY